MPSIIPARRPLGGASDSTHSSNGHSAPVIEFVCLFTHDLRRKQKRWQDGRLKYHTFNKRVMVYDDRGNFVGDMHWRREWEFDEGEEVELERGGIIVQVAECVGRQNQDLSELLDKRAKEKEQRQARAVLRSSLSAASPQAAAQLGTRAPDHFQTRHRPLSHLLGTPTGQLGRAVVPTESPFELRQRVNESSGGRADSRPTKRRKHDTTPPSKMGYAQSLFGAPLTLSAVPLSSAPPRRPTAPTSQGQPEISFPDREAERTIDVVVENRDIRTRPSSNAVTSGTDRNAASTRTGPEHETPFFGGQESPGAGRGARDPLRSEAATTRQLTGAPSTTMSDGCSRSSLDAQTSTDLVGSRLLSLSAQAKSTVQKPPGNDETVQAEGGKDFRTTTRLQLGTSRSDVIVLGEDAEETLDHADRSSKPRKTAKSTAGSKRLAADVEKHRNLKRNKPPQSPAQQPVAKSNTRGPITEDVDAPPMDERTELRIKPRQKRGLLMLSEKHRTKKLKGQDAVSDECNLVGELTGKVAKAVSSRPDLRPHAETADSCHTPQSDDAFPSSPAVPENAASEPRLPASPSQRRQGVQLPAVSDNRSRPACSPFNVEPANAREPEAVTIEPPNASESMFDEAGSIEQGRLNLSPSPPVRIATTRDRTAAADHKVKEAQGAIRNSEATCTDLPPETGNPRQTRKAKNVDDEGSGHSRRKTRAAVPKDSDNEDLPRVPVRPRLARLGRKGIRSREVIGYVPSSSPTVNRAMPEVPTLNLSSDDHRTENTPAAACVQDPSPSSTRGKLGVPNGMQQIPEENKTLQLTSSKLDAAPALQRHNSAPDGGMANRLADESREEREGTCLMQQLGDVPSRRGLARHRSAVSPAGNGNNDRPSSASVTNLQNTGAPGKEMSSATALPCAANRGMPQSTAAASEQSQPQKSRNSPEQAGPPINVTHDVGVGSLVAGDPNKPPDDIPSADTSRPRIANPATRGRKAALKSDAAGQVPQSILPAEPVPGRLNIQPPAIARAGPDANERPKRKMTFPGFTSAKDGGPWSREAHDLLESGRPG
ncbi:hypothetical protein VTK56DRAFT_8356 [Thermocarpiscus australiensis]